MLRAAARRLRCRVRRCVLRGALTRRVQVFSVFKEPFQKKDQKAEEKPKDAAAPAAEAK